MTEEKTIQLLLDGSEQYPDVVFDCPICGKNIIVERDKKGNYFHRSWMFHFTYQHGKTALKYVPDSIMVWLYYFADPFGSCATELIEEWQEKVKEKNEP